MFAWLRTPRVLAAIKPRFSNIQQLHAIQKPLYPENSIATIFIFYHICVFHIDWNYHHSPRFAFARSIISANIMISGIQKRS